MSWIDEVYDKEFANLLDEEPTLARSNTFRKVFEYLIGTDRKYYQIIETGSLRALDQWGDGQSTRLFDSFVNYYDGEIISIDNREECTTLTEENTTSKVTALTGDSLEVLSEIEICADLLYLDSFDYIPGKELESGLHHLYEMMCCMNIIDDETLIVVDDTDESGEGKGKYILEFIQRSNREIIFNEGRQLAFTMRGEKE